MIDTVSLPASRVAQQSADPSSSNVQLATSSAQNWDHLRHWQQGEYANEDIVDLEDTATDSDYPEDEVMEDEDDAHDEVVVEEQEITPSTRPRQGKLSDEEIVEIINEEISRFEARWRPGSEINPDELWEKAENDGQREQLINQSRTTIEWLQSRLEAMGDRIRALDCNSVRELRTQCKSLEGTVDQLQEAEWILSIYELELEDEESSVENSVGQHGTAEIIDLGSGSDSDAEDGMLVPGSTAFTVTTPESMLGVEASIEPHVEHTPPHAPKSNLEPHIEPSSEICKTPPIPNRLADNPGLASINSVSRWDWNTLVEKKDRKRIVMKAMQEMRWEDREMIRTRVKNIKKQNLLLEIPQCISMFIRGDKKIPGHLPAEMPKIITFTKLFLSWWLADDYFKKEATEWRLEELSECLDAGSEDPTIFYEWVRHILNNTFSLQALSKPCAPSQAEIICISDDDEPRPVPPTRRKSASNRRRPVQRPPRTPPETIELD
ncbi:hypothetical protein CC80DRAFT_410799 [Byssothecium circinans]|uniref:DUF7607 domain-containing protein n=1 Tax=Byssothecium circinans TaxID=147558 RepID=A0A6A5U0T4_9PLEO|nr:hypothetical protein CC80DRAFT_410799 [Byssothecium circinans]